MKRPPLYKYLEKVEYAESMAMRGRIRIGTLSGYRGLEKLDNSRNDNDDGVLRVSLTIDENCKMEELPLWKQMALRQMGNHIDNSPGVFDDNRHIFRDCYVYCTAKTFSKAIWEHFSAKICVKIHDPIAFGQMVTDHLYEMGLVTTDKTKNLVCAMTYYEAPYDFEKLGIRPIQFLKPDSFRNQDEVRYCWEPKDIGTRRVKQVQSMIIEVPHIKDICELIIL